MELVEDEIVYYGSVGDASLSKSVLGLSMSWDDNGHSHTNMDITNPS